jgi:hypothetical protein
MVIILGFGDLAPRADFQRYGIGKFDNVYKGLAYNIYAFSNAFASKR